MDAQTTKTPDIFISYSHRDQKWLDRLCVHLKTVEREEALASFSDKIIKPGEAWRNEIQNAIDSAKVAVILVSADLLASEFVRTHELPPLLSAAERQGTVIMPIIVSPSLYQEIDELNSFQTLNSPDHPLIGMSEADQEQLFVQACKAIVGALRHRQGPAPCSGPQDVESVGAIQVVLTSSEDKRLDKQTNLPVLFEEARPERSQVQSQTQGQPLSKSTAKSILKFLSTYKSKDSFYLSPEIPEDKLQNAKWAYGVPNNADALGLIDCTVFGSAKNGLLITSKGIYGSNSWGSTQPGPFHVPFGSLGPILGPAHSSMDISAYELDLGDGMVFEHAAGPDLKAMFGILEGIYDLLNDEP